MPRVPLPQVGLDVGGSPAYDAPRFVPLPDTESRQTIEFGQGLTQFGMGVADAARVMQDQVDDARVTEGFTKWSETASNLLSGPNGYLRSIGQAAQGDNRKKVMDQIDTAYREIESGMKNDVQRGMFREAARKQMMGIKERVYGHEAEQVRIDAVGQADALRIQSARNAGGSWVTRALNPNASISAAAAEALATGRTDPQGPGGISPGAMAALRGRTAAGQAPTGQPAQAPQADNFFEMQRNTAIAQANRIADLNQWAADDPRRAEILLQTNTMIHAEVADQLVNAGKTKEAADYVSKLTTSDVAADKLDDMRGVIRRATTADTATRIASDVIGKVDATMLPRLAKQRGAAVTVSEVFGAEAYDLAWTEIDKQFKSGAIDAEQRSIALAELDATHKRRKQMWSDASAATLNEAERLLNNDKNLTIDSPAFPAKLHSQLVKYGNLANASAFVGGVRPTTTPAAYAEVMKAVDSGELKGMSNTDLYNRFYSTLGKAEWDELQSYHAGANTAKRSHRSVLAEGQFMKLLAVEAKINRSIEGPKGEAEELRYARFLLELQGRIDREETDGRVATDDWIRKQVAQMSLDKVSVADSWFGPTEKFVFDTSGDERKGAFAQQYGDLVVIGRTQEDQARAVSRMLTAHNIATPTLAQSAWLAQKIRPSTKPDGTPSTLSEDLAVLIEGMKRAGMELTVDNIARVYRAQNPPPVPATPTLSTSQVPGFDPGIYYYGKEPVLAPRFKEKK